MKTTQTDEWARLISRLRPQRDALVEEFLDRFAAADLYGDGVVDLDDVRVHAVESMDLFISELSGDPLPRPLADLPQRLGSRRARQGVPIEPFLEAVRMDTRVLWSVLERIAMPEHAALLVNNFERILNVVEGYVSDIQQAFLDEEARMARYGRAIRNRALIRLFGREEWNDLKIIDLAQALGVSPNGQFDVAATRGDTSQEYPERLALWNDVHVFDRGSTLVLFRESKTAQNEVWLPTLSHAATGVVFGVRGLINVPAAAASAALLAEHAGPGGMATPRTAWPLVAQRAMDTAIFGFGDQVREALDQGTHNERERLLETIASYARTGSIKDSADQMYCHRNTLVNRLARFRTLTGLDMTVPEDAARALVALADDLKPYRGVVSQADG